jgi:uncharacterized cofD-like protein
MTKKRIVVVGGGTGTHTVLRGLRNFTDKFDISAVVSMADSGGSTGRLRDEFGYLPVGDVRNALTALASEDDEHEVLLRQLFLCRFSKGEGLSGHNFGNLFLTALTDILGNEVEAIGAASKILRIKGQVIPVTTDSVELVATYEDGTVVVGEHDIDESISYQGNSPIKTLSVTPEAFISTLARSAIIDADLLIFGPGDLYTSIIANCVVTGFVEAVGMSRAKIVYISNLMSKKGQTVGMHAQEHLEALTSYLGRVPDYVLVNSSPLPNSLLSKYEAEGDHPVLNNCVAGVCTIEARPLVALTEVTTATGDMLKRSLIRHDSEALAKAIIEIIKRL